MSNPTPTKVRKSFYRVDQLNTLEWQISKVTLEQTKESSWRVVSVEKYGNPDLRDIVVSKIPRLACEK